MKKTMAVLILAATLAPLPAYFGTVAGTTPALAAPKTVQPKLKFSETFRRETTTRREVTGETTTTEMHEEARGLLKLNIELPFPKEKSAAFDAGTPIAVKMGGFEFGSTLGSDPQFAPGKTSALLIVAANSPSGNSRVILATAALKWEKDKLTLKIDADTPAGGKPVAAEDFLSSLPGNVKAETNAQIQIGEWKIDMNVLFTGKVTRKSSPTGAIVTVDLKN